MIHQQVGPKPEWATTPICGRGVKTTDAVTGDSETVDCSQCIRMITKAKAAGDKEVADKEEAST